ncbi:MurR/RpiR family transcriptional regulator [Actinoallomurus sp. CA-150999]|uniref:MurR/RpiR family transcriptional regulator n=1 Tax=Actinoallomurus sp. CA-150999 TaxID=3239887 RepID=UPI003D8A8D91
MSDIVTPTPAGQATLERIRAESATLSGAERRVALAVLADPSIVMRSSVTELARSVGTSAATVVRFCQSMGLRGYQDLKLTLARESVPADRQLADHVAPGDGPAAVLDKVFGNAADALRHTAGTVSASGIERARDMVRSARRVLFAAVGTSAPLAADIAYRMTTIGIDASAPADVHVQRVTARMLSPDDLCFAISHTGSTVETLATVRAASAAGATTVALTSFTHSPLTEMADHTLVAGSRETTYRIEAMVSRIVHLTMLDALFVLLVLGDPVAEEALAATADVLTEHRL